MICPWNVWQVYGDVRILERRYESMKKFVEFCRKRSTPDGLPLTEYHGYGDWLSINAPTPNELIYTAYFAHSTNLLSQIAEELGLVEDAKEYKALFGKIKAGFHKEFVKADGTIGTGSQTSHVLPLAFGLLDGALKDQAVDRLVADIELRNGHLSTGFVGTKELMLVLAKAGRFDTAYKLLENTTFPSWGFTIMQGATSIWERWNGWTPDQGFADAGMNSFAHYAFGAVYQFMAEYVGGIRVLEPSYRSVEIGPVPGGSLTHARVSYDSIRGRIECEWKLDGDTLSMLVVVPPGVTAKVIVPCGPGATVTENGRAIGSSPGLKALGRDGKGEVFEAGSGTYRFQARG